MEVSEDGVSGTLVYIILLMSIQSSQDNLRAKIRMMLKRGLACIIFPMLMKSRGISRLGSFA